MGIKSQKRYLLVNKSTGQALDWNTPAAAQLSVAHPRIFMYSESPNSQNHHWQIEKQPNGNYLIKTSNGQFALDGNTGVPNVAPSHPAPFLYTPTPSAANHRWRFEKVGKKTYVIINEANGLALDGNVNGAPQRDARLKSPFLWTPVHSAANHQWVLKKAPLMAGHQQRVQIVNASTGQALDWNTPAAAQVSAAHPRVFMYAPHSTANNHTWILELTANGKYLIKTGDGRMALDGNTNVPNVAPSHPAPFLYTPTPSAANHRWTIEKVAKRRYIIINEANGLALDGNVDGAPQRDARLKSPFLWTPVRSAANHLWELREL